MKKLLVVLVCLAMASVASANFMIVDSLGNSSISVTGAGSITLSLIYTGTDLCMYDVELDADNGSVISNPVCNGPGSGYEGFVIPSISGYQVEVVGGYDNGTEFVAGVVLATFDVAYSGASTVSGYDYMSVDENWGPVVDPSVTGFDIIPEPATIALLCLGGLLLRKK